MTSSTPIKMLLIKQCPDSSRWYSRMVGKRVPYRGNAGNGEYKSAEPAGYTNFVLHADAEIVEIIPADLIGLEVFIVLAKTDGEEGRLPERIAAVLHSEEAAKGHIADLKKHYDAQENMEARTPMMQPHDLQVLHSDGRPFEFYTFARHQIL